MAKRKETPMGVQSSQSASGSQMMPMPMPSVSKTGPFRPVEKTARDERRALLAKAARRKSLQKQRDLQLTVPLQIGFPKES
jgi:hypothetical protein